MRKLTMLAFAALMTSPFIASQASAATCVSGTAASYVALGAGGCTQDSLLFSNFTISGAASTGAVVTAITVNLLTGVPGETGFSFTYGANAGTAGIADVAVTFDVTALNGVSIVDAFALLNATITSP